MLCRLFAGSNGLIGVFKCEEKGKNGEEMENTYHIILFTLLLVYILKNGINLNKSRTIYISLENLDILYCQNNKNHLPNSAGLWILQSKSNQIMWDLDTFLDAKRENAQKMAICSICLMALEFNLERVSSLHWISSLSFCSYLYSGVCFNGLKLSVSDLIVSQKRVQWRLEATILWAGL